LDVAADPKHLGARLGVLSVLHTWGQQLEHHPHVHAVVPGGGLTPDGQSWRACRPNFLLPVKVLGQVFRGKYLQALKQAHGDGALRLDGSTLALAEPSAFADWLDTLYRVPWVVYAKRPFGNDPEQVLKYLARYTHRVAFSNSRLVRLANDEVTFTYKDYADDCQSKELTLPALEFLRRFAMHVVPGRLVRIRQYGLLANRGRGQRLAHCRRVLAAAAPAAPPNGSAETLRTDQQPQAKLPAELFPLVVWLPLIFYGAPLVSAEELQRCWPSLPLQVPRCMQCGVGHLRTLWQAPRPRGRDLPALTFWAVIPTPDKPLQENDTS
jgi:hypothetical protein